MCCCECVWSIIFSGGSSLDCPYFWNKCCYSSNSDTVFHVIIVSAACALTWKRTPFNHIDGLVQEKRNTIANALELRLSCTGPSIWLFRVRYGYIRFPISGNCIRRTSRILGKHKAGFVWRFVCSKTLRINGLVQERRSSSALSHRNECPHFKRYVSLTPTIGGSR